MSFVKNHKNVIIAIVLPALLSLAAIPLSSKMGAESFNVIIFNAVLISVAYFIGAELARGEVEGFCLCLLAVVIVPLVQKLVIKDIVFDRFAWNNYFNYSISSGAAVGLATLFSRNSGPLRAAFGRNLVPGVLAAYGVLCCKGKSIFLELGARGGHDPYANTAMVCLVLALVTFMSFNRKLMLKLDAYIALAAWTVIAGAAELFLLR